jgi:inner membrane protein
MVGVWSAIINSQFVRIFIVVLLIIILQIPSLMIGGLVQERQGVRNEAIADITGKWGQAQTILGPRLLVPYTKQVQEGTVTYYATVLPENLQIQSDLQTEIRYRGIFEVPVYRTQVAIKGEFVRPDLTRWGVAPGDIRWGQSELSLDISDARAIQNQAVLQWQGKTFPFAPGTGQFHPSQGTGIHSNVGRGMGGNRFNFAINLRLNGSERLNVAPLGQMTKITMAGNWSNPSFQGLWLPTQRQVTEQKFQATWEIPALGRNFPQQWTSEQPVAEDVVRQSVVGVDLLSPVDQYRMAERSLKYNFLFLLLTFAAFWLFEVTLGLRVHPLQYLLVGVAMCLFYLLQLAFSEHLGFPVAYGLASLAVAVLVAFYSVSVLRANRRGMMIGLGGVVRLSVWGVGQPGL